MNRIFFILSLFLITYTTSFATNSNKWKTYLSYFTTDLVEETPAKVYAVAEGSLFSYDKEDNSIKEYNRSNVLNGDSITFLRYNEQAKSLLITYRLENIDILSEDGVTNLPYLQQNIVLGNKTINSVYLHNEFAYLSTNFGIVVINMQKREVTDTYNLSLQTTSCYIHNNYIYASTENGILYAALDNNLLDRNNWESYPINSPIINLNNIQTLFFFKDRLCFINNRRLYHYHNNSIQFISSENDTVKNVKILHNKLVGIGFNKLLIFDDLRTPTTIDKIYNLKDVASYKESTYWLAEGTNGLRSMSSDYKSVTEYIKLDGPYMNSPYRVACSKSNVYVIPGGIIRNTANGYHNPGVLMKYDYNSWTYVDANTTKQAVGGDVEDYTSIAIDPSDENNIFLSSFGYGVYQFNELEPTNRFTYNNSTIESASNNPGMKHVFQRLDGGTFDKKGNIWFTNSEVTNALKAMDTDGKWYQFYVDGITGQNIIGSILITTNDHKWVNVWRHSSGIAVFDHNGTLDNTADDRSVFHGSFTDQDGNAFTPSTYTCMAEDKNGYVWIGTSNGIIYIQDPKQTLEGSNRCYRPKLTDSYGEAYHFLDNISVTTITIDEGNRKWIGTENNGIYVLSGDNEEVIHEFNTGNSPILSDYIYSIAINHNSGEVFIGTKYGLMSYQGEATVGKEDYSDVYAFPNPVRPEFNDQVTITGLMDDTNIKITDINGHIIYQTKSIGGQATWNCRNKSGNRVASGIYLVLGSNENGGESVVTKIAVIK